MSENLGTTTFSLATLLRTPTWLHSEVPDEWMENAFHLYHGGIQVGIKINLGQGPTVIQRGPCAVETNPICICTHYCTVKAALYSPSSNNAQRQKGRKLCCNILKHKSCYQPGTASCFPYTWIWFAAGSAYRPCALVFQRSSCIIPGGLHLHIWTWVVQADCLCVQLTNLCVQMHVGHSLLPLRSPLSQVGACNFILFIIIPCFMLRKLNKN